MTQENKELLLKDLIAKSPYGVLCKFTWTYHNETTPEEGAIAIHDDTIRCIDIDTKEIRCNFYDEWVDLEHCKPYLRPMLSMTDEEKKEFESLGWRVDELDGNFPWTPYAYGVFDGVDWLNRKMFDYRGLIKKGIALEASAGLY